MRPWILLAVVVFAGCASTPTDDVDRFDGEAALAFAAGLITENGEPRYRTPGSPGHASAANWLESTMAMPDWTVSRQTFTGADFQALDQGGVAGYNDCTDEEAAHVASLTFHNLIATNGPKAKMLWLGAHWDSKAHASDGGGVLGANDGASGVGVLLQLMDHISDGALDPPFGIGIVFFDGEDGFEDCHALAGSIYFARTMDTGLVDAFILLDMVGDPAARFVRESHSTGSAPDLQDLIWEHGNRFAPDAFTDTARAISDDHLPFIEEGVPSVDIIDAGRSTVFPPYWHTSGDTLDKLDAAMLGAIGDTVWAVMEDPRLSL